MTTTTPTDASADDLVQRLRQQGYDMRSHPVANGTIALTEKAAEMLIEAANRISDLEHRMCEIERACKEGWRIADEIDEDRKASADRIEHLQAKLAEAQARGEATTQERDDMLRLMLGLPFGRSIDDKDLAWARDAITQQRAAMSGKETTR